MLYNIFKPRLLFYIILIISAFVSSIFSVTRIKDVANIEYVRDNLLVGKGLVVGLSGTGDNLKNSVFTQQALVSLLDKLGTNSHGADFKTKNIAAVIVTANLSPFMRHGSRIDVSVSALGDAKSLNGGILIATSLLASDGRVYAVAQGPLEIQKFYPVSDDVKTKPNNVETKGIIRGGAIVESEVEFNFSTLNNIKILLRSPDFSTAMNVANVINNNIPGNTAKALDPATIELVLPKLLEEDIISFIAKIEQLNVEPDSKAIIVITENTGTIAINSNVNIRPVAIAQGNLTVNVGKPNLTQAMVFMNDTKRDSINEAIDSERGKELYQIEETANLAELVAGLNKLGVLPKDIACILQNIKSAGALDAEIIVK